MNEASPTVFIVDDDDAVRDSLSLMLGAAGLAAEGFADAEAFLARVDGGCRGAALVDVRMPGMSGLDLQRELNGRGIRLPVIVITGHADVPMAVAALKAGAADFLEKPFDEDALLEAVRDAVKRDAQARDEGDVADVARRVAQLTPREHEVMDLVVAGHPNKVIAARLGISVRTVEIHRGRVMDKLGARTVPALVRMVLRLERV